MEARELTDAEVFGQGSSTQAKELSDAEVFGTGNTPPQVKELSDAEVLGSPQDTSDIGQQRPGLLSTTGAAASQAVLGISRSIFETPETVERMTNIPARAMERMPLTVQSQIPGIQLLNYLGRVLRPAAKPIAERIGESQAALPQLFEPFKEVARLSQEADKALGTAIDQGEFGPLLNVLKDPKQWSTAIANAAPSLYAAIKSGGSIPFIAWMEGMESATDAKEYEKRTGKKISDEKFSQAVILTGGVNAALEKFGLDKIRAAWKVARGPQKRVLAKVLNGAIETIIAGQWEGITELAQQINTNLQQKLAYDKDKNLFEGALQSYMGGAGSGTGAAGIGRAISPTAPVTPSGPAGKELTDADIGLVPPETPQAKPEPKQEAQPETQPVRRIFTKDGAYIDTAFELVDAKEVPAQRQPGKVQLNPQDLGDSPSLESGAPVIGPGNILEAGQQSASDIASAYESDQGQPYKQWLMENAEQFGLTRQQVESMDQPMLVRRRISEALGQTSKETQETQVPSASLETASPAVQRIENAIAPIRKRWKGGPKINVVQSVKDLPDKAAPHDVEGAYMADGQVYLVADNLPDTNRAKQVLAHEAIGHAGFERIMGDQLPSVLEEISKLEKTDDAVKKAARTVDENQPGLDKTTRAKEIIAVMAENGVQNSIIRRVIHAIRKFLREAGIDVRLDANDIAGLLRKAEKSLEKPSKKQQPAKRPTQYSRKVYTEPQEYRELYEQALKESRPQNRPQLSPNQKPGRTVEGQAPRERWYQETVVRSIDGGLTTVFRGSYLRLTKDHFALQSLGHNTKHPTSGLGVWFTMSQKEAPRFGPNVESFHLDIRNPAIFNPGIRDLPVYDLVKEYYQYRERLRARGFDAIVLDMRDLKGTMHFAVFDPNQVIYTRPLYSRKKAKQIDQTQTPELIREALGKRRIKGDALEDAVDLSQDLQDKGGVITPDGFAVLYHRTTKKNAESIVKEQAMTGKEDGLFFGTSPVGQIEGYGEAVVQVKIPLERITLNDVFTDEAHVWMKTGTIGKKIRVEVKAMQGQPLFSRRKEIVIGNSGRQYTKAQMEAMKATGSVMTETRLDAILKDAWTDIGKKMAQGIADQFAPVKEISKHAYMLLRLSKGASGAFEAFMNNGKLSIDKDGVYDADTSGGVMQKVFIPLGKETTDFLRWISGNRAERLMKEGRERLFTNEHISAFKSLSEGQTDFDYTLQNGTTTRNRRAIYQDSLNKFNEFNRNVLDIAEQSGLIDSESRHLWEHEFYVPFYRVEQNDGGIRGMNIKSGVVRQEAFKRLKGGKEQLNDLLMSTLSNWSHLIDASAKNRAAKATLKAAERAGVARRASSSEKDTVWYMGRTEVTLPDGTKTSVFMKNYYKVNDPYILTAITALEYAGMRNPAMNALSAFKHWLTIGVTASPFFKVRNLIRDSMQAIATADLSYNIFGNIVTGALATRKGTQEYTSALAAGGLIRFGTMLEGNETERTRHLIAKGASENQILDNQSKIETFLDKTIYPAIAAYNELGNRGEEINRMALYRQMVAKGMSRGEAALAARDLLDFSMAGSWNSVRFLTQVVPFMNARIQGLYKLGRAARENPARFSTVVGATALVSIALLLAYKDDDDWKRREDWDRDNYWWFKIGGLAYRIPKPFEIGAIASLAERSVELWVSDEMTNKRFLSRVAHVIGDQLAMNPIPQLVKPVIDLYANKDSFTGRPIEPMGMDRLKKEYRFTSNTSMFARGVSTGTGGKILSPIQIDYLVRSYFGWLGTFVTYSGDLIMRPFSGDPKRPTPDYFKKVTGGMVQKLEGAPSRYVSQIYDQAKVLEEAYGTYMDLLKKRRREEAKEFKKKNEADIKMAPYVEAMKRAMSGYNTMIRQIEINDKLSPEEKQRKINQIKERKHIMAQRFDQRLRELDKRRNP